jgi:hypothetical protein
MYVPQLTEQHRRLKELTGEWEAQETVFPSSWDQNGGTAECSMKAQSAIDGFFLILDYSHNEKERQIEFRAHGVIGWDVQEALYTMHWFDAYGAWPSKGKWIDDKLSFDFLNHRITYQFKHDEYVFRIEIKQGSEFKLSQEGTYRRKRPELSAA